VSKAHAILLGLLPLAAIPGVAAEDVVLSTGFRIHADRHEVQGDRVLLYAKGGVTELPASSIDRFENIEVPPAAAPAPEAVSVPSAVNPAAPAERLPPNPRELLRDAANRSGLPPAFVESVAKVESALRPDAVSPKGALGVMQLMPDTARALDADPADTAQNIDAGVRLLRDLLLRYDGDVVKALAAYNAGTGTVSRYGGLPPYPETQNYVDKVLRTYISNGGH
jgi:soluble lytic murein transglycosylase-like protein